ncbi:MAG: HXXEE domain-containing protein, partial [Prevotella sp.]
CTNMKKNFNESFLMRNWYNINGAVGVLVLTTAFIFWRDFSTLRLLAVLNFAVINLHIFEEFRFPGGFPKFCNTMFAMKDSPYPDRYPLNRMTALLTNWISTLVLYVPPLIWPNAIWFGLAAVLFGGVSQFLMHGVYNNILLRKCYNAGLAAVLLGHVPIMIAYIIYIYNHQMVSGWDWVSGIAIMLVWYIVGVRIIIMKACININSPWVFSKAEMDRFKVSER